MSSVVLTTNDAINLLLPLATLSKTKPHIPTSPPPGSNSQVRLNPLSLSFVNSSSSIFLIL